MRGYQQKEQSPSTRPDDVRKVIALTGLPIRILSSDYKVARIGAMLIMIGLSVRLLVYVRGLSPSTFLPSSKETSLSVVTETPNDARNSQSR